MYYIGANTKSCGLCRLYKNDCLECHKFTGFKMDKKKVCFREYDDWFDLYNGWSNFITQRPSISEPDFREKAQCVHDVLYDCYKKHMESYTDIMNKGNSNDNSKNNRKIRLPR